MSREILVDHKLKGGNLLLSRERENGRLVLHFRARMNTRHPADVIFDQLVLGFSDSARSWIWPLHYENTPESPPGGLQVGSITRMTYRVPRFDNPNIPAKPATYSYEWLQLDPRARLLEYRGLDHPLQGGAVVRVEPLEGEAARCSGTALTNRAPTPPRPLSSTRSSIISRCCTTASKR